MDIETRENAIKPEPESSDSRYLAWRDAKVRAVLKAKQAGRAVYKSLDEIAAKYGLNAR